MDFNVNAYSVSQGAFNTAVQLVGFGATLDLSEAPIPVVLTDEDGRLALDALDDTTVRIGDDDQGPITEVEFRNFTLEADGDTSTVAFAVISRAAVADVLLVPLDVTAGRIAPAEITPSADYVSGDEFEALDFDLTLPPPNTPPTAVDDTANVDEDGSVTVDVLANDSDDDDDTLTVTAVSGAAFGVAQVVDNEIVYTPDANVSGTETLTYTISDGTDEATATVTITVTAVNDPPVAVDDVVSLLSGQSVSIDVLANDSDIEGDTLSVTGVGEATLGTLEIVNGAVVFTSDPGAVGTETVSYTLSDGTDTSQGSIEITVEDGSIEVDGPGAGGELQLTNVTEVVTLGSGPTTLRGSPDNFNNDSISGFDGEDTLIFVDQNFRRSDITVTDGSAILDIDADGDGTSDSQITLEGDFEGGDFMAASGSEGTRVTFEPFLPELSDRQRVDEADVNGVTNPFFLIGNGSAAFEVEVTDLGFAAFDNAVGVYEVNGENEIINTRILFTNQNAQAGESATVSDVADGNKLGFFIVADGADEIEALIASDSFVFVDQEGGPADLDTATALTLTADGTAVESPIYHSLDPALNPDGLQHVLSGVVEGGEALTLGFEDLPDLGDADYEDVGLTISIA